MKTRNTTRYTQHAVRRFTITKIDGFRNWIDFTTERGNTISSLYAHDINVGDTVVALSNYDTKYNRWRVVEVKEVIKG